MTWPKGRLTDTYRADAVDKEIAEKNVRIAELEAALAERDRIIGRLNATIGILRAHVDDGTEKCSVCRGVINGYDLRARAEEGSEP